MDRLLTVDDLSERWGLTAAQVRRLVKRDGLPFISFQPETPGRMNISWRFVRFDPDEVAAWEMSRRRTFATAEPPPRPKTIRLRKLREI